MGTQFITCSIDCEQCGNELASVHTNRLMIPRRALSGMARAEGAVQNGQGDWFCGSFCRVSHQMSHTGGRLEDPDG